MLKLADRGDDRDQALSRIHTPAEKGEAERILAAVRRQLSVVIAGCILGLLLGVGYVVTAVPQFTATAVILLDNRRIPRRPRSLRYLAARARCRGISG